MTFISWLARMPRNEDSCMELVNFVTFEVSNDSNIFFFLFSKADCVEVRFPAAFESPQQDGFVVHPKKLDTWGRV